MSVKFKRMLLWLKGLRRYIPVHHLCQQLTKEQQNILLTMYCLTGCDATSAFYGHGKRKAFKLMVQKCHRFQHLATLGESTNISNQEKVACTRFVSCMYGQESDTLNALRCKMAHRNVMGKKLPPTDNSFSLHVLRCAYQLMVWRQAIVPVQDLPDPLDFGYDKNENTFHPQLMSQI